MKFKLLLAVDKTRQFYISQFTDALTKKGIDCKIIDDLEIYGDSKLNRRYLRWLSKPKELENIINQFKPNAVFTERVSHFSSLILKYNIPLIIFLRGDYWSEVKWGKETLDKSLPKEFELFTKQKIADKCFKESSLVLPICKYLEKITKKFVPGKPTNVFSEGVDASKWYNVEGLELKHPCVGLLQYANWWGKTSEMLVLKKVLERMSDVHFYWVGDGPLRERVLSELDKYDNFHWLENLQYPDKVREYLSEIDVYALVTGMDLAPLSLKEAQLMKKPVVATNVGGNQEMMVDGKTGFLVQQGSDQQLIDKLSLLLEDKDLAKKMGVEGRKFIEDTFNWELVAKNFIRNIESYLK